MKNKMIVKRVERMEKKAKGNNSETESNEKNVQVTIFSFQNQS